MQNSNQKIVRLQQLRGVAALIVTASHSVADVNRLYGFAAVNLSIPGQFGVEIFFVISGFIIFLISSQGVQEHASIWRFLSNRAWRIVPLYWTFTAVFIALAVAVPNSVNRSELDLPHIVASFLFFPLQGPNLTMSPVYSLGWSLNYEVFFYALFAIFISFERWLMVCGVSLFLITLVALNSVAPEGTAAAVWTMPYLLEFAVGMWIALGANLLSFRLPAWSFWPGICACLVASVIYFSSLGGHYAVSAITVLLASLFVLIGAFAMAPKSTRILNGAMAAVGDSSYSLYLTHMFSIRAIVLIIGYLGLQSFVPPAATWLAVVGVCAAAAYVSYLLLECRWLPTLRKQLQKAWKPGSNLGPKEPGFTSKM